MQCWLPLVHGELWKNVGFFGASAAGSGTAKTAGRGATGLHVLLFGCIRRRICYNRTQRDPLTHGVTPMRSFMPLALLLLIAPLARADKLDVVGNVEGQPLGQNAARLVQALAFLGTSLPAETAEAI